jgi:hypothetical protein
VSQNVLRANRSQIGSGQADPLPSPFPSPSMSQLSQWSAGGAACGHSEVKAVTTWVKIFKPQM